MSDEILEYVRQVDDEQLKQICPRFDIVQWLTNVSAMESRAAEKQSGNKMSPTQFGTNVHVRLQSKIVGWGDPSFRAEVSYLKGIEEDYGTLDSIRIDALEDLKNGTVCVYDIKTGTSKNSGLSPKRRRDPRRNLQGIQERGPARHHHGDTTAMTTAAQVKQVVQPLLDQNPDLALVGRLILIKPVRHLLRGVYFARSLDHNAFTPTWLIVPMFRYGAHVIFNWGQELYNRSYGPWDIRKPATPKTMCEEIERTALPLVRSVQTIDDFVGFASEERFGAMRLDNDLFAKIVIDIARGDFDTARAICAHFFREIPFKPWYDGKDYAGIMPVLRLLLAANDRAGLARVLHQWEADSIEACKLEKFWEPTPFPFELQPAP